MASSQHRCVFVGNIPYDASEEQLIEILKEVGPVVSFRLVIDRETGKPKGYGFCEYKDEETALSARRNLQGYEINGRQLRIDFAENDKGVDKNREQGRGGPGMAANIDPSKQMGGPATYGEAIPHQPIGLHSAIAAAAAVAGALGGTQAVLNSNQNGLQNQSALANDPLTLHLARMSRTQLNEIMSELKMMGTQNKELARQLLLGRPQLAKALFQAQIMLGMVPPQVLQMPNIQQAPAHTLQPPSQDSEQNQQPTSLPGIPPIAQTRTQPGFLPQMQQGLASQADVALSRSQFPIPSQLAMQQRVQLPQHSSNIQVQQATLPGQAHSTATMGLRPQLQMNQQMQMQPTLFQQQPAPIPASNLGQNARMLFPNANVHPNVLSRPHSSNKGYQSMSSGIPDTVAEKTNMIHSSNMSNTVGTRPSQASGPTNPVPRSEPGQNQNSQAQLAPDVESVLLQQVMKLTPEQLSSLPPEQQQQVAQLQQMLRRDQAQPSYPGR